MISVTIHKKWYFPLLVRIATVKFFFDNKDERVDNAAKWVTIHGIDIRVNGEKVDLYG